MKVGLKRIVAKITQGDEYGVYRETEEHDQYFLMFAVTTYKEVISYGKGVAKVLGLAFECYADEPISPEKDGQKEKQKQKELKDKAQWEITLDNWFSKGKYPSSKFMNEKRWSYWFSIGGEKSTDGSKTFEPPKKKKLRAKVKRKK